MRFLTLVDLNFVTRAYNLAEVLAITLVHNGFSEVDTRKYPGHQPGQALVTLVMRADSATFDGSQIHGPFIVPGTVAGSANHAYNNTLIRQFFESLNATPGSGPGDA